MKCLFVYNPISGKGKAERNKAYIVKKLSERFGEVDVVATQSSGDMTRIAADACGRYEVLVFAGGDGSFNEVVMGLGERENRPILGYIPTGTVNDIARSTGIPRNIKGAVKNIVNSQAYALDVMKVNDSYVMYVACSGGLTGCSYSADQNSKKHLGKIAYALEVVKNELEFDEYPVEFGSSSGTIDTTAVMIMIMNGISVASMPVNNMGVMDDGEAEVIIVCDEPRRRETKTQRHLRYFMSAIKVFTRRYKRLRKHKKMCTYKGNEFTVNVSPDIVWNFDGEQGVSGNIKVKVLNKHINLIIPEQSKKIKPCVSNEAKPVELG